MLTSAHCIDDVDVATLQIGFLERNDVIKASMPLRWKLTKKKDDYAVLKLKGQPSRRPYVSVVSKPLSKGSLISITGELSTYSGCIVTIIDTPNSPRYILESWNPFGHNS